MRLFDRGFEYGESSGIYVKKNDFVVVTQVFVETEREDYKAAFGVCNGLEAIFRGCKVERDKRRLRALEQAGLPNEIDVRQRKIPQIDLIIPAEMIDDSDGKDVGLRLQGTDCYWMPMSMRDSVIEQAASNVQFQIPDTMPPGGS